MPLKHNIESSKTYSDQLAKILLNSEKLLSLRYWNEHYKYHNQASNGRHVVNTLKYLKVWKSCCRFCDFLEATLELRRLILEEIWLLQLAAAR